MGAMLVNYKLAVANHLLDTASAVDDHKVAKQFVQRAINGMVGQNHPHYKEEGKAVKYPFDGMRGKGILSDLQDLKFDESVSGARTAHKYARKALAARTHGELRKYAQMAKAHLGIAMATSVPAGIKAVAAATGRGTR
jgi:hypothetical protein